MYSYNNSYSNSFSQGEVSRLFQYFEKTLLVVQIDTMPHIKALNLSFMVLEVQEREIIMGTPRLLGRSSNRYGHLVRDFLIDGRRSLIWEIPLGD